MKIEGVFSQAVLGIQRGISSAQGHAAEIASAGQFNANKPSSLVESMLGLKQDSIQVQASSKVLQTYDEMIGSLFDDLA